MDLKLGLLLIFCAQICTVLTADMCICPALLKKVCGSDGVTYMNECLLNCASKEQGRKLTVLKPGPCPERTAMRYLRTIKTQSNTIPDRREILDFIHKMEM